MTDALPYDPQLEYPPHLLFFAHLGLTLANLIEQDLVLETRKLVTTDGTRCTINLESTEHGVAPLWRTLNALFDLNHQVEVAADINDFDISDAGAEPLPADLRERLYRDIDWPSFLNVIAAEPWLRTDPTTIQVAGLHMTLHQPGKLDIIAMAHAAANLPMREVGFATKDRVPTDAFDMYVCNEHRVSLREDLIQRKLIAAVLSPDHHVYVELADMDHPCDVCMDVKATDHVLGTPLPSIDPERPPLDDRGTPGEFSDFHPNP